MEKQTNNIQKLGDILAARMKKTAGAAVPMSLELGVINRNLSLSTDSLKTPVPRGSYMVNVILTGNYRTENQGCYYSCQGHNHPLPSLRAGDRVLVAWCGNEPVVVALVTAS